MSKFDNVLQILNRIFTIVFIADSLYYEHWKHDIPMATLMIGWAVLTAVWGLRD
jgi:hypothetical protein